MLDSSESQRLPFRVWGLVSLLELLRFAANDWTQIIRDLRWLGQLVQPDIDLLTAITEGDKARLIEPLERIAASCRLLGLTFSESYSRELMETVRSKPSMASTAEAILAGPLFPSPVVGQTEPGPALADALKPRWFVDQIAILAKRIDDELGLREFYAIPAGRREYFATPDLFGEKVATAFPAATLDIEEAGKCFALGRWTASVFHLMRVTEHGMDALSAHLGIIEKYKTWDKKVERLCEFLAEELRRGYDKSPFKGKLDFVKQATERLTAVQLALRNETMHARSVYDEGRASEIYTAVRSFMMQLASELTEVDL
jgi:hypothetical protein